MKLPNVLISHCAWQMTDEQKEELPSAAAVLECMEYLASMFIRGALVLSEKYPGHAAYSGNPFIESEEFQSLLVAFQQDVKSGVNTYSSMLSNFKFGAQAC